MNHKHLFVTWREPEGLIHPVGRLTKRVSEGAQLFQFVYVKNAEQLTEKGLPLLPGLPDLYKFYESKILFPVFRKRQMPRKRPDYEEYLEKLDLPIGTDPFEVMARSEGRKLIDRIEVFAPPTRNEHGALTTLFFARGIRHREGALEIVKNLKVGDQLTLADEPDNKVNSLAIHLDSKQGGPIGWLPNYLINTVRDIRQLAGHDAVTVTADHINEPEVAPYMRLICRLTSPWPDGYEPFSDADFQPIINPSPENLST